MAIFDYLSDNLIENAPRQKEDAWIFVVESIMRALDMANANTDSQSQVDNRKEALALCEQFARTLGIDSRTIDAINKNKSPNSGIAIREFHRIYSEYKSKRLANQLRAKVEGDAERNADSREILQISNRSIVQIHNGITALRNSVSASTLDDKRKKLLLDHLNEFERLVNQKNVPRSEFLTRLALVAAAIGGTTAFLADAPQAMETLGGLASVVGEEIQCAEDAKQIEADISAKFLTPPERED